ACGAASAAEAQLLAEKHRDRKATAANARKVYEGLLQDKTFEQWQAEVKAVAALAATREIATVDKEIAAKQKLLSDGEAAAATQRTALDRWKERYADHAAVGARLLADQHALKQAMERLQSVPGLPDGFDSTAAFIAAIEAAQADRNTGRDALRAKHGELTLLAATLGERRSEDVAEEAEAARRGFERARSQGRAYERIRTELDRITAAGGDDPLAAFGAKVAGMFSRITGRQATVAFDGQLPTSVERDGVSLPPARLSQGASGALALALRLAMAEAHLGGGTGFIMLDDPLVNLDPARMHAAVDILRSFAERVQVIFFTCHDHHAARLAGTAGPLQDTAAQQRA
ncbi:MAG: ATP-binding protein, partial [Planctomycetia bacterium]